ncbi:MAG: hypothetical protein N4A48_09050 [Tepidibacter sp.]|jgi:hypothetical protein|uniref:hypothetical protein n=1 Tax=Tepidibacter sp. TaxID=2529387 RepID=UPI0025EF702A|nr:hypothetical protein [Tepidibacter sp.]MCT4508893.1 hypothetical protein [Tepidibacter sp.]
MKFNKIYVIALLASLMLIGACSNNTLKSGGLYSTHLDKSRFSKIIIYDKQLYACYSEGSIKNINQVKVKKYDDNENKWINVDNGCLNYNTSKHATDIRPIVHNDELYIFWSEQIENNKFEIKVKKYNKNSNTWININNSSIGYGTEPRTLTYNNELYVFWSEKIEKSLTKIKAKKYDENNNEWMNIDDSYTEYGWNQQPIVYNNELYVFWSEKTKKGLTEIKAKKTDKSNNMWIDIDSSILNDGSYKRHYVKDLLIFNNELYIISMCTSKNDVFEIQIYKFSKNSDTLVKIGDKPLNYDKNKDANYSKALIYNNDLYVFWSEETEKNSSKIKAKKYDENKNKWITIDTTCLNNPKAIREVLTDIIIYNNKVYACIDEENEKNQFSSKIKIYH